LHLLCGNKYLPFECPATKQRLGVHVGFRELTVIYNYVFLANFHIAEKPPPSPTQGPQAPKGILCCRFLVFLTEKVLKWGNFCEEMLSLFNLPQKSIAILLMFGENFKHFLKNCRK
jgi:hypothetical protein